MKRKNAAHLCAGIFLLCTAVFVISALIRAYKMKVIGGADIPTVLFAMRQMLVSPAGLVLAGTGVLSLTVCIILHRKKGNR